MTQKDTVIYYFGGCVALGVGFHNSRVLTNRKEFWNVRWGV